MKREEIRMYYGDPGRKDYSMWAVANRGIIPIYTQKGILSDEILYGMEAEISNETSGGFCYIRTEYGYEGYARTEAFVPCKGETGTQMTVKQAYADILKEPHVRGRRILSVPRGARVEILQEVENGYRKLLLYDGTTGYMKESYLTEFFEEPFSQEECEIRERVVQNAMQYRDVQYRYGGKTPLGIDCSGLTFMAYYLCGIVIYRDAKIMPEFPVHPIAREDAKPGDLIYYDGHVTMYLGEGKYIHATGHTGSDRVVINSLNRNDICYREDLTHGIVAFASVF